MLHGPAAVRQAPQPHWASSARHAASTVSLQPRCGSFSRAAAAWP